MVYLISQLYENEKHRLCYSQARLSVLAIAQGPPNYTAAEAAKHARRSSPLPAKRSSMLVILSKIKNQTGEAIFQATLHGRFTQ
jgi:hypothetical protein